MYYLLFRCILFLIYSKINVNMMLLVPCLQPVASTNTGRLVADVAKSPLEHLASLLSTLSVEDSAALKRELLVSLTLPTGQEISDDIKFGQKPTAYDPLSGSITLPYLQDMLAMYLSASESSSSPIHLRFCVRNSPASRVDVYRILDTSLSQDIQQLHDVNKNPYAMLHFGSLDRGVKSFRVKDWESKQLYDTISALSISKASPTPAAAAVVVAGMMSHSVYAYQGPSTAIFS